MSRSSNAFNIEGSDIILTFDEVTSGNALEATNVVSLGVKEGSYKGVPTVTLAKEPIVAQTQEQTLAAAPDKIEEIGHLPSPNVGTKQNARRGIV